MNLLLELGNSVHIAGAVVFEINHTSPNPLNHNSTRVTWPGNSFCKSTSFLAKFLALSSGKGDESCNNDDKRVLLTFYVYKSYVTSHMLRLTFVFQNNNLQSKSMTVNNNSENASEKINASSNAFLKTR